MLKSYAPMILHSVNDSTCVANHNNNKVVHADSKLLCVVLCFRLIWLGHIGTTRMCSVSHLCSVYYGDFIFSVCQLVLVCPGY